MLGLDSLTLVFEFECGKLVVVVFAFVVSFGVALGNVGLAAVAGLVAVGEPGDGSHTDVLCSKVLVFEVVEDLAEIHVVVVAALLLLLLEDLVQLFHHDGVHALKDLNDVGSGSDGLSLRAFDQGGELDENLLGPAGDLVVHDVDLLELLLKEGVVLLHVGKSVVQLDDFFILETASACSPVLASINLQFVQSAPELLVVLLELVDAALALADVHKQLGVGLFAGEELADHLLDVGDASGGLDGLESLVDSGGLLHLLLHLLAHEGVPESLDVERLAHFELAGVLVLVGGGLSNILVPLLALDPPLDGLLLVLDALLQLLDTLLPLLLLQLDVLHEGVEGRLRLQTLLLGALRLLVLDFQYLVL